MNGVMTAVAVVMIVVAVALLAFVLYFGSQVPS